MNKKSYEILWLIVACGLSYLIGSWVVFNGNTAIYSIFIVMAWLIMVYHLHRMLFNGIKEEKCDKG